MVSPDTIRTAIGVIGNGTALVLFLSPVPTFYRIWKKKSVEQYSAVPYIATLLNCMMWVLYGLPVVHQRSMLVVTINGTGMAIELTYIALFLAFSVGAARRRVLLLLVAEVAFVAAVAALVLSLAHTHDRRSMVVGILCVLFGTGMYAAPLSVMKMVIQTKSVEYMPLFLSVASLINGICWTTYALIRFDLYITLATCPRGPTSPSSALSPPRSILFASSKFSLAALLCLTNKPSSYKPLLWARRLWRRSLLQATAAIFSSSLAGSHRLASSRCSKPWRLPSNLHEAMAAIAVSAARGALLQVGAMGRKAGTPVVSRGGANNVACCDR